MDNIITGLNAMDIAVIVLTLLMAIKGIVNGFLKELFGFIGLIGGVFVASRAAEEIAKQINANMPQIDNFALLKLIGFLAALALIWGSVTFVGNIIVGISKNKPHSTLDRLFGFIVAGTKYFLIFSLIVAALFRSPLIKDNMGKTVKTSKLYPILDRTGSALINLSPIDKTAKIDKK